MKKKFVTPRVIQEVQICLEKDLLGESFKDSSTTTIQGQEQVIHGVDETGASYFDEGDWSN